MVDSAVCFMPGLRSRSERAQSPVIVAFYLDDVGMPLSDKGLAHDEHFRHSHPRGVPARAPDLPCQLGHHDVVRLDHPGDGERGAAHEGRILDLVVVGLLTGQAVGAVDGPLDVVGQAGQDLGVVGRDCPGSLTLRV